MDLNQHCLFPAEVTKNLRRRNRKNHNQYFTPEFAVEKAISLIPLKRVKKIIDPAVGGGVFLKVAMKKWQKAKLFGLDVDLSVIKNLKKMNLPNSVFFTSNSLLKKTWERKVISDILSDGGFDLVAGNPPFSSWFNRIDSEKILSSYQLARENGKLVKSLGIEILFLEIFINIAKEYGYIIIVLPDGILSNPQYKFVREYILKNTKVLRIINLPRSIFEDTSAKTSILILKKIATRDLAYSAEISDLDKTGTINNIITAKSADLRNRMDYHYYDNLERCSLRKLINKDLIFKPLKDFVVYCKTGKTLYGKDRKFTDKGLQFIHTTNIGGICIDHKKDKKCIKPNSKMDFNTAHTKIGDILIARVGNGCVGKSGIVATIKDMGIVSDCIFIIRLNGISPYYVNIYLKTKLAKEWFNTIKHGSAATSVAKDDILSIPVPLLSRNSQKAFENYHKKIVMKYHNSNGKNTRVYQHFERLVKRLEIRIYNGKKI
jgi:predicted RNA methylase